MESNKQLTIFVNGILHNDEGMTLILRRTMNDRLLPGYYEFPGGKLQLGENLEVTLKRKFMQEAGLKVDILNFIGSRADENKHGAYLRVFFEVGLVAGQEGEAPLLNSAHDSYIWYDGDKKADVKIAPDTAHMINAEAGATAVREALIAPEGDSERAHHTLIIYTDGGSRGNPGPSASGFVILDEQERILEKGGEYIGITTNDEAEYTGAKLALEAAKKYNPQYIQIRMDSMLVVNQMNKVYKVKNKELWPLHEATMRLANHFRRVVFQHVSREYNRLADAQVNKILDDHEV